MKTRIEDISQIYSHAYIRGDEKAFCGQIQLDAADHIINERTSKVNFANHGSTALLQKSPLENGSHSKKIPSLSLSLSLSLPVQLFWWD